MWALIKFNDYFANVVQILALHWKHYQWNGKTAQIWALLNSDKYFSPIWHNVNNTY